MKPLAIFLAALLPAAAFAEDAKLAQIARDFDAREMRDDSTKAHSGWLRTKAGKQDAAYLAVHFEGLTDQQRYEIPTELARTGAVAVVPLLEKSFAKSPAALSGVFFACRLGSMEPGFGKKVAPLVVPLIGKGRDTSSDKALELLPVLDPELARKVLFTEQFLGLSSKNAHLVLAGCNDAGLKVPRALLDPLLAAWEEPAMKNEAENRIVRGYHESLKALARHDSRAAVGAAERAIATQPFSADDLADVHLIAVGLGGLYDKLADIADDPRRFGKLPAAAQHYFATTYFESDLSNGGMVQVLDNSTGDYLPLVRKTYQAIGAKRDLEWLDWMLRPFGKAGPSPNRMKRNQQMDAMRPSYGEQEDDLAERWDKAHQNEPRSLPASWLLAVHVAKHAAEIRKALNLPAP